MQPENLESIGFLRRIGDIIDGEAQVLVTPTPPLSRRSVITRGGHMPTIEIPLTSRKYPGLVALIDEEDFDLVSQYPWYPHVGGNTFYADHTGPKHADGKRHPISMHRVVLGLRAGDDPVDHINRNGLDNRKVNLRLCKPFENSRNQVQLQVSGSSSFRGVTWHKLANKWQTTIKVHERGLYLGVFSNEVEAAYAYDAAAREYHGEFARLNFPRERERQA